MFIKVILLLVHLGDFEMKSTLKMLVAATALWFGLGMGAANAGGYFTGFDQDIDDPTFYSGTFGHTLITGTIGSSFIDHIAIGFPDFGTGYNGDANIRVGMRGPLDTVSLNQFDLFDLTTFTTVASGITAGGGLSDFTFSTIGNHSYELIIGGIKDLSGASYAGNISVSPIPEPETYAMLLAGLGLIGFSARRRRVA